MRGAALAAFAFALAACGHRSPNAPLPGAQNGTPEPAAATPRPSPTWSASERDTVRARMAEIFGDDITANHTGMAVVAGDGSVLFTRRARSPVTPASTLKLVVAAGALASIGPKHRFATRFVAAQGPDADGVVHGDVWLVGGGDPSLQSDDLRRGVGVLVRAGIRRIDGALLVDDSAFSGPEQNPRWDPDDLDYDYAAGTSAISLDEDTVEFDVTPDPGGGAARVRVVPENRSIVFSGSIATGGDTFVSIERKVALQPDPSGEPRTEYELDGHIARGEMQQYYKPVLGIPGYVGGAVAAMLAARGIELAGGFGRGTAPLDGHVLWLHQSPPLADLVHEMLVDSNNHTAETLLRILGEESGHPGTDGAGIAFEKRTLAALGVAHDAMRLYDGSGLAPSDRIMPLTLAELIAAMTRGPLADAFVRSLPLAGIEGTVKHHDLHAALGRVRAKSGHIEGVNGLAGTIASRHHGRISFAFVVNDPRANADVVYQSVDRALDALAEM